MEKADFSRPLFYLTILGLNPMKTDVFSHLRKLFFMAIVGFLLVGALLEFLTNIEDLGESADTIQVFISELEVAWKIVTFASNREQIRRIVGKTRAFWRLDALGGRHAARFWAAHDYSTRAFRIYEVFMLIFLTLFNLSPLLSRFQRPMFACYGQNGGFCQDHKYAHYAIHVMFTYGAGTLVMAVDSLFFYLIVHVVVELNMVKVAFGGAPIAPNWRPEQRFRLAVDHHAYALE